MRTTQAHDGAGMRPEAITASITWRIVHNLFGLVVCGDSLANIGGGGGSLNPRRQRRKLPSMTISLSNDARSEGT